jgi:hypothetical protein
MPSTTPFDVQLEVRVVGPFGGAGLHDPIGIAADFPNAIGPADPVPDLIEIRLFDVAGNDTAAGEATAERHSLFVCPDDHLERMASTDSGRIACLDCAEGGE